MLFDVGRETQAACSLEGVSGQRLEAVERGLGAPPQLSRSLGSVGLARDVVARRGSAERETTVAPARPCPHSASVVDEDAQARACERPRTGATRDPRADDRDVCPVHRRTRDRRAGFREPERRRLHAAMLRERAIDPVALDRKAGELELGESGRNLARRETGCPGELVCTGGQELEERMLRAWSRL